MLKNLHPYDGKDRKFTSANSKQEDLKLISEILKTEIKSNWVIKDYNLSFYSGGIGIFDSLSIKIEMPENEFKDIANQLNFISIVGLFN